MNPLPLQAKLITSKFDAYRSAVAQVYRETYMGPPYFVDEKEVEDFATKKWPERIKEPGFVLGLVSMSDEAIGMAYGWTSVPSAHWTQRIAEQLGPDAEYWLTDNFEFVDIAIRPGYQGMGAGKLLYDVIFDHIPHRTALLYTLSADTPATKMYSSLGWSILRDGIQLSSTKKFALMGLRRSDQG